MSEYREKTTVIEDVPLASRPVVEARYDSVVRERPAMSGGAIAALVLAAIAAAVVITMLILNNQNQQTEDELAQERARAAAAEQTAAQQSQQPVIVMPQSQPAAVPVPVPAQSAPVETAPSSASIEMDVTSKLLNDSELRSPSVDVRVSVIGGTVTLRGQVPTEELKIRAGKLAGTATGVRNVVNELVVQS
ncbi:MAG TPA: BON domain-containing protein [Blastocatellia bacterium]|jgi:osmotically-inducible protein OsmY|nr:BON domain-containing protein [Blastocatellia bacterium]